MSIIQFLRILWAYRWLTAATTIATLLGAVIAILVIPPSYMAKTRVMLNILKPDPITGEIIPSTASKTYIATQIELIRDLGVAGTAVEQLGWLNNPSVLEEYKVGTSDADLRRALAQRIIDKTRVSVPMSTNILEISFSSNSPDDARMMANALREAYIESTLASRRHEASKNADWYQGQAERERELLSKADTAKTAFEKANGIVMQDEKTDIETARLRALAGQSGATSPLPSAQAVSSPASIQLAQLDAQIAQASKNLGPNHPTMIQLQAQRQTLAKLVAQDQSNAARAMSASAGALNRAVEEQTSRVIANREKIEQLTQLQAEVNLHRDQMEKSLARAAELRQQAAVADSGITVMSEAISPRNPSFPNKPLILGGGLALGAGMGLMLSLLLEFLQRRVRGPEDLIHSVKVPLMAVITSTGEGSLSGIRFRNPLKANLGRSAAGANNV